MENRKLHFVLLSVLFAACGDGPTSAGVATEGLARVSVRHLSAEDDSQSTAVNVSETSAARYVGIFVNDGGGLSLAEVEILDATGANLARGRNAYQPSEAAGAGPELAVDGDPESESTTDAASAGADHVGPHWWMVDLGANHEIASIKVVRANGRGQELTVATMSEEYRSPRHVLTVRDEDALNSRSSAFKCSTDTATDIGTAYESYTCSDMDEEAKFQSEATGTVYYECEDYSEEVDAVTFTTSYYISKVDQDIDSKLDCVTATLDLCLDLENTECSMWCSNFLRTNPHYVTVNEIKCEDLT